MEKRIKTCLVLCCSTAMAFNNIFVSTQDQVLTNCVTKIVQEWNYNTSFIDLNLMNVDDIEISTLHKVKGLRFISRTFQWSTNRIYNVAYVIQTENCQKLKDGLIKAAIDRLWNSKAKFIIIVKNLGIYGLFDIRNLLFYFNIYDITLIAYENENYAIYKFNATSNNYCRRVENLVLVSWCSEYVNKKNLPVFARSDSIGHCRFKFITHKMWPFTNFDGTNVLGIEQRLIRDFEKYEGVKIELHLLTKKLDKYGDVVPNYIYKMLKKVEDNEFEGSIGGHTSFSNYTENLSFTYPVMIGKRLYVLAHGDALGPWEGVLERSPLSFIPCAVVFIILCIAASSFSIFPIHGRDIFRDAIVVMGYILNKTIVKNIHPKLPQKIIFMGLLYFAFFYPYVIQGNLFSSITKPIRNYEPKKFEELSGYTPIYYTEYENRPTITGKTCGTRLNCLLEVKNSETKTLYTIVSYIYYLAYTSKLTDEQCNLQVYALEKAYNIEFRMILLRRGSVLLDRFNKVLLRMASAGLVSKYFQEIKHFEDIKCKLSDSNHHMPLKMDATLVPLTTLIVGYIISVIIFIIEIILGRSKLM